MPLAKLELALRAGKTHFGDPVLYQRAAGGAPFQVVGVFSAPHDEIDIGAEAGISTTAPMLGVELSDFAATPRAGDTFVRAGITWRVEDVQPDGEGGADLILHEL